MTVEDAYASHENGDTRRDRTGRERDALRRGRAGAGCGPGEAPGGSAVLSTGAVVPGTAPADAGWRTDRFTGGGRGESVMAGWLVVHGWPDWNAVGTSPPERMLFQVSYVCGVYPRVTSHGVWATSLLFVNCEHAIQETVAEVEAMLRDGHVDGFVAFQHGQVV